MNSDTEGGRDQDLHPRNTGHFSVINTGGCPFYKILLSDVIYFEVLVSESRDYDVILTDIVFSE